MPSGQVHEIWKRSALFLITTRSVVASFTDVVRKASSMARTWRHASDGAAGVLAARMAARAAVCNVRINLGSIKDELFTTELRREADRLEAEAEAKEKEILAWVKL